MPPESFRKPRMVLPEFARPQWQDEHQSGQQIAGAAADSGRRPRRQSGGVGGRNFYNINSINDNSVYWAGTIRGYPVQIFHKEEGVSLDSKNL